MANAALDLIDVLNKHLSSKLIDLHTALPGVVQKYYSESQRADVQIAIKRKKSDGEEALIPVLPEVPVMFPRNSNSIFHFPLAEGDTVLVVFNERDCDNFRSSNQLLPPATSRKFHLSDAVCIPGFNRDTDQANIADATAVSLSSDADIKLARLGEDATENAVCGVKLTQYLTDIHTQLAAILDILIAGTHVLTTTPGNPTAPNPTQAALFTNIKAALAALKTTNIDTDASNILAQKIFIDKGV